MDTVKIRLLARFSQASVPMVTKPIIKRRKKTLILSEGKLHNVINLCSPVSSPRAVIEPGFQPFAPKLETIVEVPEPLPVLALTHIEPEPIPRDELIESMKAELAKAQDEARRLRTEMSMFEPLKDLCGVCLEPILNEDLVSGRGGSMIQLPCRHFSHGACLDLMCTQKHVELKKLTDKIEGVGGPLLPCVLNCAMCRAFVPSTFEISSFIASSLITEISKMLKNAIADATVRRSVSPVEIQSYCRDIRSNPDAVFSSTRYKMYICETRGCHRPYIGLPTQCGNENPAYECYKCISSSTWAKHVVGLMCDNCETVVERTGGCSHMTCACGYQFCYICGGEYTGFQSMRATASSVRSIPFCEQPQPGARNRNGNPKRFGKCLCIERNTLETSTRGMNKVEMAMTCLAPAALGYMHGYGYQKLILPF
jgi:hypothetical protein